MSYKLRILGLAGNGEYLRELSTGQDERSIQLADNIIQRDWSACSWFMFGQVLDDKDKIIATIRVKEVRTEIIR